MAQIWLYHINPNSPQEYNYDWNTDDPRTLVKSGADRTWAAPRTMLANMKGDFLFVFFKGMKTLADGVYVAGRVMAVDRDNGFFEWAPLHTLTDRLLKHPVTAADTRATFGRLYGGSLQLLPVGRTARWMSLVRG